MLTKKLIYNVSIFFLNIFLLNGHQYVLKVKTIAVYKNNSDVSQI